MVIKIGNISWTGMALSIKRNPVSSSELSPSLQHLWSRSRSAPLSGFLHHTAQLLPPSASHLPTFSCSALIFTHLSLLSLQRKFPLFFFTSSCLLSTILVTQKISWILQAFLHTSYTWWFPHIHPIHICRLTWWVFTGGVAVGAVDDGQLHKLPLLQLILSIALQQKTLVKTWKKARQCEKISNSCPCHHHHHHIIITYDIRHIFKTICWK